MTISDKLKELRELAERASQIPGFPGYWADDEGTIWSEISRWRKWHRLSPAKEAHGYLRIRVIHNGKRKKVSVHRLVCLAFHGKAPSPLHQVCHNNGIRDDNRPENLRWGTPKDNARDRILHGNDQGAKNGRTAAAKLRRDICLRGHPRTKENIRKKGQCKICERLIRQSSNRQITVAKLLEAK